MAWVEPSFLQSLPNNEQKLPTLTRMESFLGAHHGPASRAYLGSAITRGNIHLSNGHDRPSCAADDGAVVLSHDTTTCQMKPTTPKGLFGLHCSVRSMMVSGGSCQIQPQAERSRLCQRTIMIRLLDAGGRAKPRATWVEDTV